MKVRHADHLHPQGKPIAIDGRLRSTPSENRYLSLFFLVSRCKASDEILEANLKGEYPSISASVKVVGFLDEGGWGCLECVFEEVFEEVWWCLEG